MNDTTTTTDRASPSLAFGALCGATMALGAATSFAVARAGALRGLTPDDMIFARALVAGLVMLPVLLRWGLPSLAGIGWRRELVLLLTGGPLFAFLQTGGYAFAPLAHGAIIAPSTVTLLSTLGAVALLGERLTVSHVVGGLAVIAGVVLVSWHGLTGAAVDDTTWIGDLMFVTSSVLWAGFTLLMRKWRIDPLGATAVVPAISILIGIPLVGEVPDGMQIAGLGLVSIGLLTAVGFLAKMAGSFATGPVNPALKTC